MSSEWNFAPDVIVKAQEIGIGARVVAHWTEFECPDQGGTVVGVEIHRYGKVEYTVHLDGDISPTDGFSHDPTGQKPGTISIRSGGEEKDGVGVGLIDSMSDKEFDRDRSDENPNVGKVENIADAGKMVLAPVDPTKEMVGAATRVDFDNEDEVALMFNLWHAMVAAAPQSSVTEPSLRAENERLRKDLEHAQKLFRTLQDAATADVNAKAKLDEAVKVLEPFARAAGYYSRDGLNDKEFVVNSSTRNRDGEEVEAVLRRGDFRAARSFLSNLKGAE